MDGLDLDFFSRFNLMRRDAAPENEAEKQAKQTIVAKVKECQAGLPILYFGLRWAGTFVGSRIWGFACTPATLEVLFWLKFMAGAKTELPNGQQRV